MPSTSKIPLFLIAPSGAIGDNYTAHQSIEWLTHNGFDLLNQESINRKYQRFAGTDNERLADISKLSQLVNLNKKEIVGIGLRGGYGLSRILHKIDWETLALAVDNGLVLVGHSDFTALSMGLLATSGKYSLAGPMISPDFSTEDISKFTWNAFQKTITEKSFYFRTSEGQPYIKSSFDFDECILWGGNLTIINSLIGTSFFPNQSIISNGIFFIEDVNEHPYRIERMLIQLIEADILNNQRAILLGDFSGYKLNSNDDGYDLNHAIEAIQKRLTDKKLEIPIFTGLPFGHIADKLTIPVGVAAKFSGDSNGFEITSNW